MTHHKLIRCSGYPIALCGLAVLVLAVPAAHAQDSTAAVGAGAVATTDLAPITVVTRDMIDDIGARHLKDVLLAYVPGMTSVQDQNEMNIALHGVYGSAQQKFLVLLDGHVLNVRSLANGDPDYAISLDQIDRIEVTRGPASAVYGQGALMGVVNLFTRPASGPASGTLKLTAGSFGQTRVSGQFSGQFSGSTGASGDVLIWGSLFRSTGQLISVPAASNYSRAGGTAEAILDGFRDGPSRDVGLRLTHGRLTVFAANRSVHYVEPFSAGGPTGEAYTYDAYAAPYAPGPGQTIRGTNLRATVRLPTLLRADRIVAEGYFDRQHVLLHTINDPSIGAHQLARFSDWDLGGILRASGGYQNRFGAGRWTGGVQVEQMRVDDSSLFTGVNGLWTSVGPKGGLLELGAERTWSGFAQMAQTFSARWSGEAAFRYDWRRHHRGEDVKRVSPAVRLRYAWAGDWSVSGAYTEGFLDAPYWYRYNSFPSYRGGASLKPDYLRSFSITPERRFATHGAATFNVFRNELRNAVWRNNSAPADEPIYRNGGELASWGVEPELRYQRDGLRLAANMTYQRVLESLNYNAVGGRVLNIPTWTYGATAAARISRPGDRETWIDMTARYVGEQLSPINITAGTVHFFEPDRTVDRVALVHAGIRADLRARWQIEARAFNLFDTAYEQGGSVVHPYPQPGRSLLVTLSAGF